VYVFVCMKFPLCGMLCHLQAMGLYVDRLAIIHDVALDLSPLGCVGNVTISEKNTNAQVICRKLISNVGVIKPIKSDLAAEVP